MRVRNARDLLAGCLFLVFGWLSSWWPRTISWAPRGNMGPAYFPVVLSLVLIVIGLATVARAFLVTGLPSATLPARRSRA